MANQSATTTYRMTTKGVSAVILSASVLLLPMALGLFFAAIIKGMNPAGVDVTNGLAYLREILIVSWALVAVFLIVSAIVNVIVSRQDRPAGRAAWVVWITQVALGAILLLAQWASTAVSGG